MRTLNRMLPDVVAAPCVLAFALCLGGAIAPAQEPEVPPDTLISLQLKWGYPIGDPEYTVTIDASGMVNYQAEGSVRVTGRQTARIPVSAVAALLAQVERLDFFALRDSYSANVSHVSPRIVTVTARGRTKRVEDRLGAPESFDQLWHAIYEASGIERWVFLDVQSLDDLVAWGWSARTDEGAIFLTEAIQRDLVPVARRLIELGADLGGWSRQRIPPLLLAESEPMVELLVRAGADLHQERDQMGPTGTPLMAAARKKASVAEALLKAGATLDQPDDNGHTALWFAACAGNPAVVRVLLAAGANPRGSWASPTALECVGKTRQDQMTRFYRTLNHGHPTDQELDEVAAMLRDPDQRPSR